MCKLKVRDNKSIHAPSGHTATIIFTNFFPNLESINFYKLVL